MRGQPSEPPPRAGIEPATGLLSRRALLAGALGTAATVAVGCGQPPVAPAPAPAPPVDVAALVAAPTFHIAHRGGGGNWPEMTAYAYARAVEVPGIRALEVSVCRSADGVLVASHDPTTTRMTGAPYTIAEQSWATLSRLQVTGRQTTDPRQPSRALTRFDEIAEAHLDRSVLFVEAKVSPAIEPLLARLAALGQPQRVVWKAPVNSRTFARAKELGFATWGYVLNEPAHVGPHLEGLAASPHLDLLGAPRAESDTFIRAVSAAAGRHGKVTISWTIRSHEDERRVVDLGCRGLMTSHPLNVLVSPR